MDIEQRLRAHLEKFRVAYKHGDAQLDPVATAALVIYLVPFVENEMAAVARIYEGR